jgi:Heavy metal associated domain 2
VKSVGREPIPEAYLCHLTPQRARIRIPSRRGNRKFFINLANVLEGCPGVQAIDLNPSTGSVLLINQEGIAFDRISGYAQEKQLFRLASPGPMMQAIMNDVRRLDGAIRSLTGEEIDLASVGFATLAGMGLYQLARGQILAPAVTVLWYAASVLLIAAQKMPEIMYYPQSG